MTSFLNRSNGLLLANRQNNEFSEKWRANLNIRFYLNFGSCRRLTQYNYSTFRNECQKIGWTCSNKKISKPSRCSSCRGCEKAVNAKQPNLAAILLKSFFNFMPMGRRPGLIRASSEVLWLWSKTPSTSSCTNKTR